jgi:hypothetical protein
MRSYLTVLIDILYQVYCTEVGKILGGDQYIDGPMDPKIGGGPVPPVPMVVAPMQQPTVTICLASYAIIRCIDAGALRTKALIYSLNIVS